MTFSIALLVYVVFTATAAFGLVSTAIKSPFPQKWVWVLGFGILTANALCNALYQHGGMFVALLPMLYPLMAALETTATLALVVGAYSSLHKDSISSHWYSLPTGCAPITMLAQYFPSYYIQVAFVTVFLAYVLVKERSGVAWVLPFGLFLGSTAVRALGLGALVLSADELSAALLAAASLIFALLATGASLQIGKVKLG
mmetsp:Transcript_7316/g.12277  ORF Transcript_7316/g.12277 Transcript_7316/m.12277 type:complete len:200 (-) Transcript_7316:186-785(-)|eukprot:CAMPEP_0114420856 /NCGR_PEP_ID=MMETSP0103-20121206/4775_1 /TAXON_ID=37642 ORGANISM="Paraphysomonas imperforata, Strain PA2" /NCGR_SAMPLE_ID=MMETSP0103 /ASSEMBLY_ACC=CAM_ASM_000201 /LENGTH=199 /DNA_ID=CAMNT_0001589353 /DNA_START=88 /DNA_END=687 /DNA_ORIENTATION=-